MIKAVRNPLHREMSEIIDILKRTGQITTDKFLRQNAKKYFILRIDNEMAGFAVEKKSRQDGYSSEVGYMFIKPEYRRSEEAKEFVNAIDSQTDGKMYVTVVNPPIERLLRSMGYGKMDQWENDVDTHKKIKLYTNARTKIIKDKEIKGYDEDFLNARFDDYFRSAHDLNRQSIEFSKIPEFANMVETVNQLPYKAIGLNPEGIATIMIKKFNEYEYPDPNEQGIWHDLCVELFVGDPEMFPGDGDKEKLYDNLEFIKSRIGI